MESANLGRYSAVNRIQRRPKALPRPKYNKVVPLHPNKILEYLGKHNRYYTLHGNNMVPELRIALKENGISPSTYKRIILNETIVTLDELHIIAKIIKCNIKDLI